jgi:hypothetical protein
MAMTKEKYICRGDDHEDLTEKVHKAILEYIISTFGFSIGGPQTIKKPQKWHVIVECSQGHKNSFEGEDYPSGF